MYREIINSFWKQIYGKNIYFEAEKNTVDNIISEFEKNKSYCLVFDENSSSLSIKTEVDITQKYKEQDYDRVDGINNSDDLRIYELCKVYKMAGRQQNDLSEVINCKISQK